MFKHVLTCLRAVVLSFAAALALGASCIELFAQSYPSKTVKVMVPAPAGVPPDIMGRLVASEVSESNGWQVVVENKPGAIMTLGLADVLRQPADGYTIASIALSATAAPALLPDVKIKLDDEFSPVIQLATAYHVVVVHPSVPAKTLGELVPLMKNNPEQYRFSSGGFGTPAHLAGEMFKLQTGVRATHVPYGALPRAIADLLNGTNHFQIITPLPVLDLIEAGRLRALAITGPKRLPMLQNVPTVAEAGYPDLIIQDWFGLLVKRGTPDEITARWNEVANKALTSPRVRGSIERIAPRPLVPEGWREVPASGEGGERVFVSPNGVARLTLGHIPAHRAHRGRDMDRLMYREGERITYQRRGGSWLAVSGYRNGEIFYRKSNLACRGTRWHTIELEYPREAKEPLDLS